MKLLVDVNLSPKVVAALRDSGHDAIRTTELLDARAPDEAILAEALRRGATIVTRDQDFSALLARNGATGPSLINLRVAIVEHRALAKLIDAVVRDTSTDLAAGAIVSVDDARIRIHRLPIA